MVLVCSGRLLSVAITRVPPSVLGRLGNNHVCGGATWESLLERVLANT